MVDVNLVVRRATEDDALRSMFIARKEVFVDLLKWDLPTIDGTFEVDQFDDPYAQYLILMGDGGQHKASARLLPSTRSHILGNLYPQLCEAPVPQGNEIFEITRFCLDRNQNAVERRSFRNQLVTAIAEHAIRSGIKIYTGVAEFAWFQQIRAFGWDCENLGPPVRECGKLLVGLRIIINDETISGLKRAGTYETLCMPMAETAAVSS